MQRYTVYFIWKLLYMFRVVVPPEKCRAVSRENKLCNVASCWIYILEHMTQIYPKGGWNEMGDKTHINYIKAY